MNKSDDGFTRILVGSSGEIGNWELYTQKVFLVLADEVSLCIYRK
jgi:hypothetical protein